jgi:GTP cyclohydrolase II
VAFASGAAGSLTVALLHGDVDRSGPVLVHEHLHCLLGDTFASSLCQCRATLDRAIAGILHEGAGVILYTKGPGIAPFTCARSQGHVDRAVAAGLLARAGVRETVPV